MTQIDFYHIPAQDQDSRWAFACRVVEKAWKQNERVLVNLPTGTFADFDQLLWAFRSDAFIPHGRLSDQSVSVHLSDDGQCGDHHGILINLDATVPDFYGRFDRLIELVDESEEWAALKRPLFKQFKDQGYPLRYHDMRK